MKKLILFLILFMGFAFKPFSCKASQLVVSPSDLQYIGEGFQSLQNLGVTDYGVVPAVPDSVDNLNDLLSDFAKMDITTSISSSDFTVEEMPIDVINNIINGEYVQNDGSPIPTDYSRLQYVSFDNGFYSGHAVLYEGEIVCTVDSSENLRRVCDVRYGGSELSLSEHKALYSSFADEVRHDVYNFGGTVGRSATYYVCYGSTRYGSPAQVESVFITNQYIPGLIVPGNPNSNNGIQSWYTNDPDLIQHNVLMGSSTLSVTQGSYTQGNYTYNYLVEYANGIGFNIDVTNQVTLDQFLNGSAPGSGVFVFGKTGYYFSNSLYNDSVPFYPTDDDVINLDDSYAVDDVISFPLKGEPEISKHYNPSLDTTADNYPIVQKLDGTVIYDPTISTPGTPEPPTPDPQPIPELDTSFIDIPFFTGLERRFPFCIPWDIKRAVQLLSATPEPPAWDFYWDITVLNHTYSYHCVGDLSAFSGLADILRKLLFLSSFIGLGFFTYKHFF